MEVYVLYVVYHFVAGLVDASGDLRAISIAPQAILYDPNGYPSTENASLPSHIGVSHRLLFPLLYLHFPNCYDPYRIPPPDCDTLPHTMVFPDK